MKKTIRRPSFFRKLERYQSFQKTSIPSISRISSPNADPLRSTSPNFLFTDPKTSFTASSVRPSRKLMRRSARKKHELTTSYSNFRPQAFFKTETDNFFSFREDDDKFSSPIQRISQSPSQMGPRMETMPTPGRTASPEKSPTKQTSNTVPAFTVPSPGRATSPSFHREETKETKEAAQAQQSPQTKLSIHLQRMAALGQEHNYNYFQKILQEGRATKGERDGKITKQRTRIYEKVMRLQSMAGESKTSMHKDRGVSFAESVDFSDAVSVSNVVTPTSNAGNINPKILKHSSKLAMSSLITTKSSLRDNTQIDPPTVIRLFIENYNFYIKVLKFPNQIQQEIEKLTIEYRDFKLVFYDEENRIRSSVTEIEIIPIIYLDAKKILQSLPRNTSFTKSRMAISSAMHTGRYNIFKELTEEIMKRVTIKKTEWLEERRDMILGKMKTNNVKRTVLMKKAHFLGYNTQVDRLLTSDNIILPSIPRADLMKMIGERSDVDVNARRIFISLDQNITDLNKYYFVLGQGSEDNIPLLSEIFRLHRATQKF
eukprot:TRINITY_DN2815_c0_g1_i3.p1 TRINITY_DN2815_c0_g1~~TRINITY_DN2815_c0_g1_i3.p1  ORF type:complete len:543 (-),score=97.28 TRINITY_DN2815_c0_g1_i3:100-1728(-)